MSRLFYSINKNLLCVVKLFYFFRIFQCFISSFPFGNRFFSNLIKNDFFKQSFKNDFIKKENSFTWVRIGGKNCCVYQWRHLGIHQSSLVFWTDLVSENVLNKNWKICINFYWNLGRNFSKSFKKINENQIPRISSQILTLQKS